jgi:hypothetical protein
MLLKRDVILPVIFLKHFHGSLRPGLDLEKAMMFPEWFSQESLTDFYLYVAMAQITLEAAKSRSSGWILWPENRFLRKP